MVPAIALCLLGRSGQNDEPNDQVFRFVRHFLNYDVATLNRIISLITDYKTIISGNFQTLI